MKYEIRELSVSEILDQALAVIKDNFGVLVGIGCVLQVPIAAVSIILLSIYAPGLMVKPGDPAALQNLDFASLIIITAGTGLVNLVIVLPLTVAATTFAISDAYLGKKPTIGGSFSRALSRFFPLIWTSILFGLAFYVGLALCLIPGILVLIWFALSTQIVVLEPMSGPAALQRSKQLMQGYALKWFVLMLVIGAITFGVNMGASLVGSVTSNGVVAQVIQTFGQIVAQLIGGAVLVILYFSARCTHENFDLELLAHSFGESPAGDATGGDQFVPDDNPFQDEF